jgi:hypothetical protein
VFDVGEEKEEWAVRVLPGGFKEALRLVRIDYDVCGPLRCAGPERKELGTFVDDDGAQPGALTALGKINAFLGSSPAMKWSSTTWA